MHEGDLVGAVDAELRGIVASHDTRHGDDIVGKQAFHDRHLVKVQGVFTLSDGRVAVGVDGANRSLDNLHAGRLQQVVTGIVGQNLGNGLHLCLRQGVAIGEHHKLVGVTTVDAREFNKAVIDRLFTIGQHLVADSQVGGNSVVVEEEVDTGCGVLDVDVTAVDEGHDTLHQSIFVVVQGLGCSDGHRLDDGVLSRGDLTVEHTGLSGHGLHRGGLADGDGIGVNAAVRGRVGTVEGVVDSGILGGACEGHLLRLDI